MRVQKITKKIFLLTFKSKSELGRSMLRFEEYYESPRFKAKIFTFDEYKSWYIKNSPKGKKTGKFTYYTDWAGFNIPSYALLPFYSGKFDPLSKEEKIILDRFKGLKKFYVIAVSQGFDKVILNHEIAHGLFYTEAGYKRQVIRIIKRMHAKSQNQINNYFIKYNGYHKDVWLDETHAYVMTELKLLKRRGVDIDGLKEISTELKHLFKKYYRK